jgi:DnaK suppressor protein
MSEAFEGLRAQGEVNRILDETLDGGLDDEFIARQRARLESARRGLLREHAWILEYERRWGEGHHYAPQDPEDVRAHILAEEVDTALDRRILRRLSLVERALRKIDEGTYGVCDATGRRIPKGRLQAVPEAVYTLEAQQNLERRA